jgi:hypothetical protein
MTLDLKGEPDEITSEIHGDQTKGIKQLLDECGIIV